MAKIIGIDLGTTNSEAAVVLDGRPVIIPSQEGQTLSGKNFPSVVAFNDKEERLVGELAKRQAIMNPEGTIIQAKRKMGTSYKFKVKVGNHYKDFRPEEISSMVLQKIKSDAEAYLGEPVKQAVITVPAYFNDDQRQATKDAGRIAGLEVLRIINEPTAAAIAYGLDKDKSKELKIIVLDLGGGTFDVTCMEMASGVLEVISTSGDTQLGGSDMDVALIEFLTKEILKTTGVNVTSDLSAMQRIREAAEAAKIQLTSMQQTKISIPYLTATSTGPVHFEHTLNRAKLIEIVKPIIDRLEAPIVQALKDAKWDTTSIDKVVLVGGPTRMPVVKEKFESIVHKKGEGGVDPMQCVAMGAALQAGILTGEIDDLLLLDVTPLTLSVETLGGIASPLIERNTTIPVKKSQVYSTAADNQPGVEIHITQGERKMSRDNKSIGRFVLNGIPPAPRGVPQIEVTFDIDSNGILNVTAKDLGTGKSQSITISGSSQLKEDEIKKMVDDAKKYEDEDKKRSKVIEVRNQLESLIYQANKLVEENKDKISSDDSKSIKDQIERSQKALSSDDIVEIESNLKELQDKLSKIGAKFYSQSGAPGGQPQSKSSKSSSTSEDDAMDVDYEVEEDK